MAVPKKKMSRSRTRRRKAQWRLERPHLVRCVHCSNLKRAHQACPNCGVYKDREILELG